MLWFFTINSPVLEPELMIDNIFRDYQIKLKKDVFKNKIGRKHFDIVRPTYDKKFIIAKLKELESFLVRFNGKYKSVSGFRYLPNYSKKLDSIGRIDCAFKWNDTVELKNFQNNNPHVRILDIRNDDDYALLKDFFSEEMSKINDVLNDLRYPKKEFPIPLPFTKCGCINCLALGLSIPDLFFRTDSLGTNQTRGQITIEGSRTYHSQVPSKPLGYYGPETHTLFIMMYLSVFIHLWEPLQSQEFKKSKKQYRLRDSLKSCVHCNDYFLSKMTVHPKKDGKYPFGVYPCCNKPKCLRLSNLGKVNRQRAR